MPHSIHSMGSPKEKRAKYLATSMTKAPEYPCSSEAGFAQLRAQAGAVAAHAYAPYSQFRVGAALLLASGEVVTGCNVENCSYRLTCCAEQAAVARAVSEYGPGIRLRAVAIANLNDAVSMPCGACRQTLAEFGDDSLVILYPGAHGEALQTTLGDLLPHAFRLEFLKPAAVMAPAAAR